MRFYTWLNLMLLLAGLKRQVYDDAKKTLKEKLRDDYNRVNINTFTISADIIFQAVTIFLT